MPMDIHPINQCMVLLQSLWTPQPTGELEGADSPWGDTGHREVYSAASDPVFIEATSLWSVSPSGSQQPPSF